MISSPIVSGDDMLYFYESENFSEAKDYFSSDSMQASDLPSTNGSSVSNQESVIIPEPKILSSSSSKRRKCVHRKYLRAIHRFICISKSKIIKKNTSQVKYPKKEYLRTKLIRGNKRAIRQALSSAFPLKTINKIDQNNLAQIDAWETFKRFIQDHRQELAPLSRTETGPLTDGKSKRPLYNSESANDEKTCNDTFVRWYFSVPFVDEAFRLYVLYLFAGQTSSELCNRFEFYCCQHEIHGEECEQKWEELRNQLLNEFISIHVREGSMQSFNALSGALFNNS